MIEDGPPFYALMPLSALGFIALLIITSTPRPQLDLSYCASTVRPDFQGLLKQQMHSHIYFHHMVDYVGENRSWLNIKEIPTGVLAIVRPKNRELARGIDSTSARGKEVSSVARPSRPSTPNLVHSPWFTVSSRVREVVGKTRCSF